MCGKGCLGSKLSYIIAAAENTKRKSKVYVFSHQTNKSSIIFLKSILLFFRIVTWQLKRTGQERFKYFMNYFWTLKISTLVY